MTCLRSALTTTGQARDGNESQTAVVSGRAPSRGNDLCLDRLILGIGNEPVVQHFLGFLQPTHRIGLTCRAGRRIAATTGADLNAAGTRSQFLQLTHAALLAPRLILRLANAIHRLRLVFTQALELDPLRALPALRGKVGRLPRTHNQVRSQHSHA